MSKQEMLNCTFCKAKPKKAYWLQSKVRFDFLGSSLEYRICADCQKKIYAKNPGSAWLIVNDHYTKIREQIEKLAKDIAP